jgi:hypothetical protein
MYVPQISTITVIFWGMKLVAFWTNQKLGIFFLSSAVLANFSHFWKKIAKFYTDWD